MSMKGGVAVLGALAACAAAWGQPPLTEPEFFPGPPPQPVPRQGVPPMPGAVPPPPGAGIPPGMPPPPPPVGFGAFERPHRLRDYSLLYIEAPPPREIKVHDIITILVQEQAELSVNSRFNRNRMGNLKAELKEFIRLDDDLRLANAADNQPKIDANLTGRLQSLGDSVEKEAMIYRIAAMVVDIRPNGNLVLEARKSLRSNHALWEYRLSGELPFTAIAENNTARSEDVYNLDIVKWQKGKVHDSTRRPWGLRLYDLIFPF